MICPKCGKGNDDGLNFCGSCGTSLVPPQGGKIKSTALAAYNIFTIIVRGIFILMFVGLIGVLAIVWWSNSGKGKASKFFQNTKQHQQKRAGNSEQEKYPYKAVFTCVEPRMYSGRSKPVWVPTSIKFAFDGANGNDTVISVKTEGGGKDLSYFDITQWSNYRDSSAYRIDLTEDYSIRAANYSFQKGCTLILTIQDNKTGEAIKKFEAQPGDTISASD